MNIMNTDTNKAMSIETLEALMNAPIVVGHTLSWEGFRNLVDRVITQEVGVGIDDLPDTCALDDYWSEDMLSHNDWIARAKEAAAEVLDYAGYEGYDRFDDGYEGMEL